MPPVDAPAEDLKCWMAGRLGLTLFWGRCGDTTRREAYGLWCAIVDSLVWQRERQGAALDLGHFLLALQLPALQRRAEDGDAVLTAYLSRVAVGGDGHAVLYRARHAYIASFLVGELVREADDLCKQAAASLLQRTAKDRGQRRWRPMRSALLLAALGAVLMVVAIVDAPPLIGDLFARLPGS
jgi:hypothetical protein